MSRVGRRILIIPNGVSVDKNSDNFVTIKGPKGELSKKFSNDIEISISENKIETNRNSEVKKFKQLHGTTNALINNMIIGVSQGYKKELKIVGVGYRASLKGNVVNLLLGHSHPINIEIPKGISVEVPKPTQIIISGIDKEMVGEFAAIIRSKRLPEPYLGKGVMYIDEKIIRKAGKTAGGK